MRGCEGCFWAAVLLAALALLCGCGVMALAVIGGEGDTLLGAGEAVQDAGLVLALNIHAVGLIAIVLALVAGIVVVVMILSSGPPPGPYS